MSKALMAERLIEVLDYLGSEASAVSCMAIARQYGRPQSSTSDLLNVMEELGLLVRNQETGDYSLAARSALLGVRGQPSFIKFGGVLNMADEVFDATGRTVAVFARCGLHAQIIAKRNGLRPWRPTQGTRHSLIRSIAGQMLLSRAPERNVRGIVHRLNAEAPEDRQVPAKRVEEAIRRARDDGYLTGPVGFGTKAQMLVCGLPGLPAERAIAVGVIINLQELDDKAAIRETIMEATRHWQATAQASEVHSG